MTFFPVVLYELFGFLYASNVLVFLQWLHGCNCSIISRKACALHVWSNYNKRKSNRYGSAARFSAIVCACHLNFAKFSSFLCCGIECDLLSRCSGILPALRASEWPYQMVEYLGRLAGVIYVGRPSCNFCASACSLPSSDQKVEHRKGLLTSNL